MQKIWVGPQDPKATMETMKNVNDMNGNKLVMKEEKPVRKGGMTAKERKVVFAASLGTVIEWYDFYVYGALGSVLATKFFSGVNPQAAFIFTLFAFAAGFAVRPIGALMFGRFGDTIGRKYTFLITMALMGGGTFLIGFLPTFQSVGIIAPVLLIILRITQGLALGGEYGGAATYVAEHSPNGKRGYYTSFIQTQASCGLMIALVIILLARTILGEEDFTSFGWRIPFVLSGILLGLSIWIRLKLKESPMFQHVKDTGNASKSPLLEAFGNWKSAKLALFAMLGTSSGEAVMQYTGQFYTLFFLTQTVKVDPVAAQIMVTIALALVTPGFCLCGWLSDKIGRKPVMATGFALASILYFPIFWAITHYTNPALEMALAHSPVTVVADPSECSFQFNPVGSANYTTSCDIAKSVLIKMSVNYNSVAAPAGTKASVNVGNDTVSSTIANFTKVLSDTIVAHGYPPKADPAQVNYIMTTVLLTFLMLLVCLVYGPIAAWLVELFPTRIRYSAMSLPYHVGNGWFGGFLPATAFAIVAATGNIYSGLWYPVSVTILNFFVAVFILPETKNVDIETMT